jgi:hypothetical protein
VSYIAVEKYVENYGYNSFNDYSFEMIFYFLVLVQ